MSTNAIPPFGFVSPQADTGTANQLIAQVNALLAQQIIGAFPTFTNDGTGSLTTAAVAVWVCMLVELRVISGLLNSTNSNLDQIRADELNNVVPPGAY